MTTDAEPGTIADTIKVAVVEDHPITRSGLAAYLHLAGCAVVSQENAVETLAELRPPPEVVVCDLHLPGRSGASAIAYLTELGTIVLATSGVAKPEEVLDAIAAGAHGFLA
jgi:DNA-binding NarL/FixJ family response regulator